MRVYSDKLNKPFDTEEECIKAEKEYDKEQKRLQDEINKAVADKKAREEALNASKKELAKAIESAQAEVNEANNVYEAAKEKATSIINEAKKKAGEILSTAKVKVREAEQKKYEAISAFNRKFGPYTTTLTGTQAADEYNKTMKRIAENISNFWSDFWTSF
ncbi:hypothetical protein [uncultured Clostridium sp.]|uniref:hypothetical protein n=1 Tax=uncultured Clostridium sp. TaxID=59620 RepID=UPI00262E2B67|nr:hypothetical protein [uncultured Clostridium sp.]